MISLFSDALSLHSALREGDIEREIKRINQLYVLSGTAMWFQQYNMVNLSENWSKVFGIPTDEIFLLEDYLALIEDEEERNRIWKGRESLISQSPGFEWSDTFTLQGRKIQTTAVVAKGCIFGMDRAVGLR